MDDCTCCIGIVVYEALQLNFGIRFTEIIIYLQI